MQIVDGRSAESRVSQELAFEGPSAAQRGAKITGSIKLLKENGLAAADREASVVGLNREGFTRNMLRSKMTGLLRNH
jgi:hypothetical protein